MSNFSFPVRRFPVLFILLSMALCMPIASDAQENDDISTIVTQLVADYAAARTANDSDAIRHLFTPDADQLVSSGVWRYGIDALVEGMMRSSSGNPGDRTLTVERVRQIGDTAAVADARYVIKGENGRERKMWSTFIAERTADGWKLAGIRNMLPAGAGQ